MLRSEFSFEALVLLCLSVQLHVLALVVALWEPYPGPWVLSSLLWDKLTEWGWCHENWNQWDSSGVWNMISLMKEYIWSAVVEKHVRSVLTGCSAGLYSAFSGFSFQCQYLTIFTRASTMCCKIFINEDYSFSRTRSWPISFLWPNPSLIWPFDFTDSIWLTFLYWRVHVKPHACTDPWFRRLWLYLNAELDCTDGA